MSNSFIWFQLFDSVTGQPHKGTTASTVSISSSADVIEFRDAVKNKHSNKLSSIDAADLLVYKNKSAFDMRDAAVEEGKEEPLDPTKTLGFIGSKEDMIVVAVPSLHLTYQKPKINQVQFFNRISNASERDDWISFDYAIPSTNINCMYVRECYKTIATNIMSGIDKAVITGTPGIGKSLFFIYLLLQLLKMNNCVLIIYSPFNIYYDGNGRIHRFASGHLPLNNDDSFWNKTLWFLFDAKDKNEDDLNKLPYLLCKFIVSMSPRRELVNHFSKPPLPQVFYMPPWTETELKTIARAFPDVDNWPNRFAFLGGIPRHVLEVTNNSPKELLNVACQQCDLNFCIKIITQESTFTDKSNAIHILVHMTSAPPYTKSSVCFASLEALKLIVKNNQVDAKRKMRNLLSSCKGSPLTAALCRYIFEWYAIELLENGDTFKCRMLVHGNKRIKLSKTKLRIPNSKKTEVDRVDPNQTYNQLHVPKYPAYPGIDAWIPGFGAFQMTVGKNHSISSHVEGDLAMLGRGANKLYWLLLPSNYDSFVKKSPHNIDQYAMEIPYPE